LGYTTNWSRRIPIGYSVSSWSERTKKSIHTTHISLRNIFIRIGTNVKIITYHYYWTAREFSHSVPCVKKVESKFQPKRSKTRQFNLYYGRVPQQILKDIGQNFWTRHSSWYWWIDYTLRSILHNTFRHFGYRFLANTLLYTQLYRYTQSFFLYSIVLSRFCNQTKYCRHIVATSNSYQLIFRRKPTRQQIGNQRDNNKVCVHH